MFGPLSRFEHGPTPFLCSSLVMARRVPLHNKIYEDHTFEKSLNKRKLHNVHTMMVCHS